MQQDRRDFLKQLGLLLLTPYFMVKTGVAWAGERDVTDSDSIFSLSVASGDPSPKGVVLWTRINPEAIVNATDILYFEIALDREFKEMVYTGGVEGAALTADRDYTVSVDLAQQEWAKLQPYTSYYYRFIYRKISSRIGHCKTLPLPNQTLDKLRFAQLSCQDFSSGHYHAFAYIAQEQDIDFVVHLGDFIYEYASFPKVMDPPRKITLPGTVAMSLDDYRSIYRQYRQDPNLQRAMENHTWIITTDDHETANNSYWDYEKATLGVSKRHPIFNAPAPEKTALMLAAQKAWVEYIPARVHFNPEATHPWECLRIYRRFRFGNLAELHVADTRTYRSDPDSGTEPTMLGAEQKEWLVSGIKASDANWQLWANQTLFSQFGVLERITGKNLTRLGGKDAWDGYPKEREQVLTDIKATAGGRLVILTGDMHSYVSSYVKIDYNEAKNNDADNVVGIELMTPAISSPHLPEILRIRAEIATDEGTSGLKTKAFKLLGEFYESGDFQGRFVDANLRLANPHLRDFAAAYNGYTIVNLTPERVSWEVHNVNRRAATAVDAGNVVVRGGSYLLRDRKIDIKLMS